MALSISIDEYLYSIYLAGRSHQTCYEICRWKLTGLHGDAQPETTTFRFPTAEEYPRATNFASVGSKIYMIGGLYLTKNLCSTDIFVVETLNLHAGDPAQIVRKIPSVLHAGVRSRNAVAIGGKIYTFPVHFGHRPEYPPAASRFEVFDPATETSRLLPEPPVVFSSNESDESYLAVKTLIVVFIKGRERPWMFSFDTAGEESGWRDVTPESNIHNGGRFYMLGLGPNVIWEPGQFGTESSGITRREAEENGIRSYKIRPNMIWGGFGVPSQVESIPRERFGPESSEVTRREIEENGGRFEVKSQQETLPQSSDVTRRETEENGGGFGVKSQQETIPESSDVTRGEDEEWVYPRVCTVDDNFLDYVMKSLRINHDPFPFSKTYLTGQCATPLGGRGHDDDDGSRVFATLELQGRSWCHAIVKLEDDPIRIEKWYRISGIPEEMVGCHSFSHGGNVLFTYGTGDDRRGIAGREFKMFSLAYVCEPSREYYAARQVFSFRFTRPSSDSLRDFLVIPVSIPCSK